MKRKIRVRLIREDAAVQPATFASDVDVEEVKEQKTTETTDTPPPSQQIDVDKLSDEEVMNYVYFNVPKDVDSSTLQSLHARADQIRQKRTNGNMSPQDQEKFANGIIAAAQQSKNVNESVDFVTKNLIDLFRGKLEERGRRGSLNWIGNNLYEEIEEDEHGRIHYFNKWIGHIDRKNKTISINISETTDDFIKSLKQAAHFANFRIQKTDEVRRLIDMGYEDDDFDPMYDDPDLQTEAYSSGRVDSFNEPSWADASFDDEEDSTHRHSYIPSQTSEEFMKSDEGKKAKMLMPLKDAISDRIEEITDGEIDYTKIYDFVDDYITCAHEEYNLDEMKEYSKFGKGKVDFFAKDILKKYRKQK